MFKQAKQNRVFQDIVDQIEEAILSGKVSVGSKLPPERELKDLFNTSRGTLREALRVLEQKGLIEIKLGVNGGIIVKELSSDKATESLAMLLRSQIITIDQLSEFRVDIEGNVASLAAKRATIKNTVRLKALLEEARKYTEDVDWDSFIRIDQKIHLEFAVISKNPIYLSIQRTIQDNIFDYYMKYLPKTKELLEEDLNDLTGVIDAVLGNDSELACSRVREHVAGFSDKMREIELKE
ncbi:MAG: FadR family transcriptional regulator [Desulfobacterales bacterium]|nr:FadR family transcriptional regulator [Desulfobacterales bacterium]MCP4158566.1 FadR family transcriptional regulator [Deltaproteobacteria bacterium]